MCGIAGIFDPAAAPDERLVERMTRSLAHRGPDEHAIWSDEGICLGHRRLKILDLSPAARQPMASPDASVRLVYNGEVYNFPALRRELESHGRVFRSTGDTEVVLHAYLEWGDTCFERFNGMFALALWDGRRRALLLARDPFGIKQLYVRRVGNTFAFASEPQVLLPLAPTRPDDLIVASYLERAVVDADPERTFFAGIRRLSPGTFLTVDARGERRSRFWHLTPDPEVAHLSTEEREERLRELFIDAVRIRLQSDVTVGSCLSGGIDSSAVIGALATAGKGGLQTFTSWSEGPGLDERRFARAAAEAGGFVQRTVELRPASLDADLDAALAAQGEPVSTASVLAQRAVMRLARDHGVTVLLDGQGGDELFAGYHGSFGPALLDRIRAGHIGAAVREARATTKMHSIATPELIRETVRPLLPRSLRAAGRRRAEGRLSVRRAPLPATRPIHGGFLRKQLSFILEQQGLPALLRYEDRNSMAFSIEARLPFLDPRLVRFAHALPPDELVQGGVTKSILRRALAPLLPQSIRDRTDKVGFAAPDRAWLAGPGYARVRDVLADPSTRARGYLHVDRALRLLERHRESAVDASRPLWRAFNLEMWLRTLDSPSRQGELR